MLSKDVPEIPENNQKLFNKVKYNCYFSVPLKWLKKSFYKYYSIFFLNESFRSIIKSKKKCIQSVHAIYEHTLFDNLNIL